MVLYIIECKISFPCLNIKNAHYCDETSYNDYLTHSDAELKN